MKIGRWIVCFRVQHKKLNQRSDVYWVIFKLMSLEIIFTKFIDSLSKFPRFDVEREEAINTGIAGYQEALQSISL